MKPSSDKQKYLQVQSALCRLIQTMPVGAELPGERELSSSFGCNLLTVRKLLKELASDGTVVRRIGSGTFVAPRAVGEGAGREHGKIGVVIYQEGNAYARSLMRAVAHAGEELHLDIKSIPVHDLGGETLAQIRSLKKDQGMAVTLPWFPHDRIAEMRKFVMNCPLPVSLPLIISGLEECCFEREGVFGGSSTTVTIAETCRYLRALGHQLIAFIGPDSANDIILQKKISGYVHYTSRENLPSLCGLVRPGVQAMDQLAGRWKAHRGKLAVVSYDDEHALSFMTAMQKIGLRAPKDYCIVGYNDTDGSAGSDPPLTTVRQNFDYIGQTLLKSAQALAKGQVRQSTKTPRLELLVRESCGGRDKVPDLLHSRFTCIDLVVEERKRAQ